MSADHAILRSLTHEGRAGRESRPRASTAEVGSDASSRPLWGLALMARPRRGTLKRRPTKQGISYGVAFTYRGEEFYVHFGGEWEGWDQERAAEEQWFLMEKVNRGEWTPAKAEPARRLATAVSPTFQVEASQWLHRQKIRAGDLDGRSKTIRDLEWRQPGTSDTGGPLPPGVSGTIRNQVKSAETVAHRAPKHEKCIPASFRLGGFVA